MEESKAIEMIKRIPTIIQNIENPTDEMKLLAISKNGLVLKYIKNPTKEMQKLAIENNVRAIQYIENPSEKVQLEAIKISYESLRYLKSPSLNCQIMAIKNNESAIQFIKDLNETKISEFLKVNILVIKYITKEINKVDIKEILKEVLSKEDVEEKYVRDFLHCSMIDRNSEIVPIDKIMFIHKYGSKKSKKIAVDERLKMI